MSDTTNKSSNPNPKVLYVMASVVLLLLILLFLEFQFRYQTDKEVEGEIEHLWLAKDSLSNRIDLGIHQLSDSIDSTQHYIDSINSKLSQWVILMDNKLSRQLKRVEVKVNKIENQIGKGHSKGHSGGSSSDCDSPIATYHGIDFNHWGGDDLSKVLSDNKSITFAIIKATDGETYTNPNFKTDWEVLKKKKMIRGAYHFFEVNDDPQKAAQNYFSTVGHLGDHEMAPIIDIEESGIRGFVSKHIVTNRFKRTLEEVERLFGRKPIIYADQNVIRKYLTHSEFGAYKLWLASYSDKKPFPPKPWRKAGIFIWQKKGNVGYEIEIDLADLDQFHGQICDLWKD